MRTGVAAIYVSSAGQIADGIITWGKMIASQMILKWAGLLVNIPTGWHLCDGTVGTPDLREKFIKGTAAGQNPGATGGALTHTHGIGTYAAANESSHTHGVGTYATVAELGHVHDIGTWANNTTWSGGHTHGAVQTGTDFTDVDGNHQHTFNQSNAVSGIAGVHSHTITGSSGSGSAHTHTLSGSSAAASSEPVYYALAFIMRV